MCQAYEAEANLIRFMDACKRERDHELQGRNARRDGTPREEWMSLTYRVRLDLPDDVETMHTPAWWMAHSWDGPRLKAWLKGWDDEDRRLAAGGLPLTDEERQTMEDDLGFLERLRSEVDTFGLRGDMGAPTLCRLLALANVEAEEQHRYGTWSVLSESAYLWIYGAIDRIEVVLVPHLVESRRRWRRKGPLAS